MAFGPVIIGGPCVPVVPFSDFDKIPSKHLEEVWSIVGPSVARNIGNLPLWKVIAAAYCEGLIHGHAIGKEQPTKGSSTKEEV
jgi:hypothetical protein